ncbi:MAG: hypothetical protein KatS3mg013_0269 [Actinomycetota bacterium]|jgi:hypothetical protein|nr:MAG: hypothetical protein KatS3mg013_0269 [Actinomycetota bacterium]
MRVARLVAAGLLAVLAVGAVAAPAGARSGSIRFFGNGVDDIDRVKIRVDDPTTSREPPRPADVGRTDFTIEWWLRAASGNDAGPVTCGTNVDWIYGNVIVDRDRYNAGRKFGVSLAGGRIVFGVTNASLVSRTICGDRDLRDGRWHHVAVQRRRSDGMLWLWVDGRLEAKADGPNGDVSYPDGGVPGSYCGGPCTRSDPFLVIGAEKHDAGPAYPSFHGWVDELRISTTLRYRRAFDPPRRPFRPDAGTAVLYHLDESSGTVVHDALGGADGVRRVGGDPVGPRWSRRSPFA